MARCLILAAGGVAMAGLLMGCTTTTTTTTTTTDTITTTAAAKVTAKVDCPWPGNPDCTVKDITSSCCDEVFEDSTSPTVCTEADQGKILAQLEKCSMVPSPSPSPSPSPMPDCEFGVEAFAAGETCTTKGVSTECCETLQCYGSLNKDMCWPSGPEAILGMFKCTTAEWESAYQNCPQLPSPDDNQLSSACVFEVEGMSEQCHLTVRSLSSKCCGSLISGGMSQCTSDERDSVGTNCPNYPVV